jgi:signal recognition particle GTPase
MERVVKYALRMPAEFQVLLVKDAVTRDNALTNTKAFNEWATKNSSVLF